MTRLERGKIDPDTTTLRSLARELSCTAAELLGESVQRPTFYASLRAFFEEHPLLPVNEGEREWLLSHRFPNDHDIGDKDYWMAQLILFRQQVRANAGSQVRESPMTTHARRPE